MIKETSHLLPWIPIVPLVVSLFYVLRPSSDSVKRWVFLAGTLPGLVLGMIVAAQVSRPQAQAPTVLTAANEFFFADGLSALMICATHFLVIAVGLYSFPYLKHPGSEGVVEEKRVRLYFCLLLLFCGSLTWMVVSNDLLTMLMPIELTTIITVPLIALYRTRSALEAAFKYNLLLVMAILFALMGVILIYTQLMEIDPNLKGMSLLAIGRMPTVIPAHIALLIAGLFLTAFGTKGGLFPFHAWLPDAHSVAPSPISALLSGLVIAIGPYCLARLVSLFSPHFASVMVFTAVLGSVSILVGIVLALVQDDLKRLLAYSSVSQISYVFAGIGLGSYLGIYGGLFHTMTHLLAKGLLFFCAGAILYRLGIRKISELGGLSKKMPLTALCFFIAGVSMGGLPLFAGFMSKYTIILALGQARLWWAMGIAAFAGLLTLICLVWAAQRVFWGEESEKVRSLTAGSREIPLSMLAPMLVIAALIVLIGVFPQALYPLLDSATRSILAIFGA
jgi:formate hydrogenlyase subunit 3/multisubunit Na+/H+ antiporter MnhD subunit